MRRTVAPRKPNPTFAFVVDGESEISSEFKNVRVIVNNPYLQSAIMNAAALDPFDLENPERAVCEMHELFLHEELKPCLRG
jgi:hypothetical protein